MRSSGACSGSDLTEATRQRRRPTFNTAAILSVGLNDSLNGADVSHLEVLCDFLQVQSPEIPILAIWEIFGPCPTRTLRSVGADQDQILLRLLIIRQ